jgi:hypothetical protein
MKHKNKEKLFHDLARISKQIGILPNEVPKLILDRKEMQQLLLSKRPWTGNPIRDKRVAAYGQCCYSLRTIFVDAGRHVYDPKHDKKKGKHKATYRDFLHTLVHELVHYRFAYMTHGRKFEERIKEILRGRMFEPKHVHLFSQSAKRFRQSIDGKEAYS